MLTHLCIHEYGNCTVKVCHIGQCAMNNLVPRKQACVGICMCDTFKGLNKGTHLADVDPSSQSVCMPQLYSITINASKQHHHSVPTCCNLIADFRYTNSILTSLHSACNYPSKLSTLSYNLTVIPMLICSATGIPTFNPVINIHVYVISPGCSCGPLEEELMTSSFYGVAPVF